MRSALVHVQPVFASSPLLGVRAVLFAFPSSDGKMARRLIALLLQGVTLAWPAAAALHDDVSVLQRRFCTGIAMQIRLCCTDTSTTCSP